MRLGQAGARAAAAAAAAGCLAMSWRGSRRAGRSWLEILLSLGALVLAWSRSSNRVQSWRWQLSPALACRPPLNVTLRPSRNPHHNLTRELPSKLLKVLIIACSPAAPAPIHRCAPSATAHLPP